VIRYHVDDDPDAQRMRLADQFLRLGERAEHRIDGPVVGDVVAGIRLRGGVPGAEPHGVDLEVRQVAQVGPHTAEVTDPVPVAVGEAARVDLVDNGGTPPFGDRLAHRFRLEGWGVTHGNTCFLVRQS
jgi:hypothetical protein